MDNLSKLGVFLTGIGICSLAAAQWAGLILASPFWKVGKKAVDDMDWDLD